MTDLEIIYKILDTFEETQNPSCEPFEVVVNKKNKTVSLREEDYELQPREKSFIFKKENGSCYLDLKEEY